MTVLAGGCDDSSTSATSAGGAGGVGGADATTSTGTGDGGAGGQGGTGQGGSAGGSGCVLSFQDDFSAANLDTTLWEIDAATGMNIELVNGRLTFTPTENFNNTRHAVLRAAITFDLTGCSTWVEVLRTLPQGIPGETFWTLAVDAQTQVIIRVNGTVIQFQIVIDGNVTEEAYPYDADAHRWWRVRDEAGVMYLETSPSGDTWTQQLQQSHSSDLSAVRPSLVMHTNAITGTFEGPEFDNVNALP